METTIIWHRPIRPNVSGHLEHHFDVSGPQAPLIHAWLIQDNRDHGEWRLSPWGNERFQIWADLKDARSFQRVTEHIARLKAAWGGPEHLVNWQQR